MSADPRRDESIERLLRRMGPTPSAGAGSIPAVGTGFTLPETPCVGPEALAGWADGGLLQAERESIESHLATCPACQAMLGAFVRATPEPSVPQSRWLGGWRLAWLVGSATLAAMVTIWISLSDKELRHVTPVATTARVEPAVAAAVPVPPSPAAAPLASPPAVTAGNAARPTAAATADAAATAVAELQRNAQQARVEPVVPPRVGGVVGGIAPPPPAQTIEPPAPSRAFAATPAPPVPSPASADTSSAAPAAPLQAASGERSAAVDRVQIQRAGPPFLLMAEVTFVSRQPSVISRQGGTGGAAAPAPGVASGRSGAGGGGGRGGAAVAASVPARPELVTRWRIATDGAVSRSTDTGATWTPIPLAPGLEITAGDAPSASVCWLIGRRGVVLLSIDTGARFSPLPFPEPVDLIEIKASDARQAIIDTSDGRTFTTTDAGVSWRLIDR